MKYQISGFILYMIISQACMEPITSIHIQNYDGPIYLHAPLTCKEQVPILQQVPKDNCHRSTCDRECTCVSKQTTKCVPLNTASESSCVAGTYYIGNYPQCPNIGFSPAQCDTQIYYTLDTQRCPVTCSKSSDYGPVEQYQRDTKGVNRCCKQS